MDCHPPLIRFAQILGDTMRLIKCRRLSAGVVTLIGVSSQPCIAQDAAASPFEGRTITLTISCSRAGTGTVKIQPKAGGRIDYFFNGFHTPIQNGSGPNGYTSTMSGNSLTIHQTVEGLAGVSFTHTVSVSGNTCSAQHVVEPGQYMDSIDPSCRASRCVITPQQRPTVPSPSVANGQKPTSPTPTVRATPPATLSPTPPSTVRPTTQSPSPVASPAAATTKPSMSCGSTITGANLAPAPKEQCDKGKKWLGEARTARKSWFGGKQKAEPLYMQAAQTYREAGDNDSADFALEESKADDVTVYERAEKDAEDRPKNLREAESQKDIARKIELGAYDSRSCGDLLKAADYYLESARLYMRANEFQATNALLLRRDELVKIADDAKQKGACEGKALYARALPKLPADTVAPMKSLTDGQCAKLAEYLEQQGIAFTVPGAAMRVQVAPLCGSLIKLMSQDCTAAKAYWRKQGVASDEIARRQAAANCQNAPFAR